MKRETEEERAKRQSLYESYKTRGGTLSSFARSMGISYWKAQYAITKCHREELQSGEGVASGVSKSASSFREVKGKNLPNRLCEYTVGLKNGRRLRIPENFSPESVQQLVEVLER